MSCPFLVCHRRIIIHALNRLGIFNKSDKINRKQYTADKNYCKGKRLRYPYTCIADIKTVGTHTLNYHSLNAVPDTVAKENLTAEKSCLAGDDIKNEEAEKKLQEKLVKMKTK